MRNPPPTMGQMPLPAGPMAAPVRQPGDGVRSLLAIALAWTVVTVVVVGVIGIVRPPVPPTAWDGWPALGGLEDWDEPRAGIDLEDPAFRIVSINGEPAHLVDEPQYTVHSAAAALEIEVLKDELVECWTDEGDDFETVGDRPGTWTVRIDLLEGHNYLGCWSDGPIGQVDFFEVVFDPASGGIQVTTVDGVPRDELPADGYEARNPQVTVRGTASRPDAVVCSAPACQGRTIYSTGGSGWSVQVELRDGWNILEFHDTDDPSDTDNVRVYLGSRAGPGGATTAPSGVITFSEGKTLTVGSDVQPGTYRTRTLAPSCFWERRTPEGNVTSTVRGYAVVEIGAEDVSFVSGGCGEWSSDLSAVTGSTTGVGEGTLIVGTDLLPGTWTASPPNPAACTWSRLRNFGGDVDAVIEAGEVGAPTVVVIEATDAGFTSTGCGEWVRQ